MFCHRTVRGPPPCLWGKSGIRGAVLGKQIGISMAHISRHENGTHARQCLPLYEDNRQSRHGPSVTHERSLSCGCRTSNRHMKTFRLTGFQGLRSKTPGPELVRDLNLVILTFR